MIAFPSTNYKLVFVTIGWVERNSLIVCNYWFLINKSKRIVNINLASITFMYCHKYLVSHFQAVLIFKFNIVGNKSFIDSFILCLSTDIRDGLNYVRAVSMWLSRQERRFKRVSCKTTCIRSLSHSTFMLRSKGL